MYRNKEIKRKIEILELNLFGKGATFNHLGVAVKSIKDIVSDELMIVSDEVQKVAVAFINLSGIKIELIEPLDENSPISSSLKEGRQLIHLCFQVPDLDIAIKQGRENSFHCIAKPVTARAFKNKRIVWLFSRTYGLIELLEE